MNKPTDEATSPGRGPSRRRLLGYVGSAAAGAVAGGGVGAVLADAAAERPQESGPRPPGATWEDESVAFGTVWNTDYSSFAACDSTDVVHTDQHETSYPPSVQPVPPAADSCAQSGGGGARTPAVKLLPPAGLGRIEPYI